MKHTIKGTKPENVLEWHLLEVGSISGGMFVLANGETVLSVKGNVVCVFRDALAQLGLEIGADHL